jgi:hypothetical protein
MKMTQGGWLLLTMLRLTGHQYLYMRRADIFRHQKTKWECNDSQTKLNEAKHSCLVYFGPIKPGMFIITT